MKTKNTFVLALLLSCSATPDLPTSVKLKCLPFRSHTTVLTLEETFDSLREENLNKHNMKFLTAREFTNKNKIKRIVEILEKIVTQKPVNLDDYDVRASISLEGKQEKYYFNWDRKLLIYRSKIYNLSPRDYKELDKLVSFCQNGMTSVKNE